PIETERKLGVFAFLPRIGTVVVTLCIFLPSIFWKGGVIENETVSFLIQYTDPRPLAQKIFDPRANDFGMYQARELSYLIDYVDAAFHVFLLRHFNVACFIPLSALISSLLIILVFKRGVHCTLPSLDRVTTDLLLLVLL